MDKGKAIELLKQCLDEVPKLRELHYDNQEFKLWLHKVETIIKNGLDDDDFNTFSSVQDKYFLDDIGMGSLEQEIDYLERLQDCEAALKSIIQKYELLGVEEKPTPIGKSEEVSKDGEEGEVMKDTERKKLIDELKDFFKKLRSYQNRQRRRLKEDASEAKDRSLNAFRLELQRYHARLKDIISQYGGEAVLPYLGREYEVFSLALGSLDMRHNDFTALDGAISLVNKAIARIESLPKADTELQEISDSQKPKDNYEAPTSLFDKMQFHPKVIEVSKDCFIAGNYREAILNAFICLIDYVKERTGLDLDGDDLMNQVFSINYDKEQRRITKYPIIRINELQNKSDRDEQQGFMFLCKGAAGGIRNPKAHKLIPQSNPLHTLEYLAFASLLMRRIEEGKVVKTSQSRRKWDWDSFIKDTKNKCEQKIIDLTKNLYDFTSVNSDSISWGTGINDGSFTFRKLSINGEISIFSVYSCGWVYINFGSMINKTVPDSIIETFRTSLNSIPNINIPKSAITDGKYARIYENPLTNSENLLVFKYAVLTLCRQLESSEE